MPTIPDPFYRTLFEAAGDAIFLMREETFAECNACTLELFGCRRETILGRTPWAFSPPRQPGGEASEPLARHYIRLAYADEPQSFEWRHRRPDGGEFDVEVRLRRVDLPDGPILQAIVRDITARKAAEAKALSAHAYVKGLFDVAEVILLVLDKDGRVERINQKGCEILGRPARDIQGKDWFRHFLPKRLEDETRRLFQLLMQGEEEPHRHHENPILTASGEERQISWHNALLRDAGGHLIGTLSSGVDITEKLRETEALRLHARIVANVPDHLSFLDRDYVYRVVNDTYCHAHARPREAIEGHTVTELFGREVFESAIRPRLDRCLAGEVVHYEDWFDFPALGRRYMSVAYTPDVEAGGSVGGVIVSARDITDLRLAREALRDSEERNGVILETAADAILAVDEANRVVFANPAAARLTGYPEAELRDQPVTDLIPERYRDQHNAAFERYLRSGQPSMPWRNLAFMLRHRDGHEIPVEVSFGEQRGKEGHLFIGIMRDVTERRRTEQVLREREERIQLLLDSMAEGMYGVDTRGQCIFVNPAALHLLGYDNAEALVGRHIHEIIHHSHADGGLYAAADCRAYRAYTEDRGIHVDDEVFWRRDGTAFPVEYWSYPMRREGTVVGSVVTFQDISERRQAADKLQATRQMLEDVINTVPQFVFWKDRQCNYLGCNEAFARAAGVGRPEGIIGKNDYELAWRQFADLYRRDDTQVMDSKTPKYNIIEPVHVADGGHRWLRTSKVPLRNAQDQIIGVLGVFEDITVQLEADEKLRQAAKVFESTMEGITITTPDGTIIAVNPAFTAITGYTEDEVLGENPRLFKSGRHDESFYQALWASIIQTGSWQGEIWNRRKNGEIYPEWLTINSVRDGEGKVSNYVGVFTDISQIKQSEAQLEHMAHHDPLTDLPNRLLLGARLDHAIQRARRDGTAIAILFVDLDRFKTVNDSLGHPAGDHLLKEVAQVLSRCVRGEDTVARLGGDEFVIVLEGLTDTDFASGVAQKVLAALTRPFHLHEQSLIIGASIGISLYPTDGDDAITLLKNADAAMYRSKEDGRNVFRYYSAELTRSARERLAMEMGLRHALEKSQFILHYQPQISVADGGVVGTEALVRWQHPESGLISPLRFIPLAEETGLIVPLGEWVLNTACEQLKTWLDAGLPPLTLAVNLSARQFRHRDLIRQVHAILDATDLDPARLVLEITEGAIMEQGESAISTLRALKDLGVKLAIDDFGTGYSSLAYLKRFPIDTLKIDQSFMRDIPRDTHAMEIAATIIAMARNLRMRVLAEGVETEAQLTFLQIHGCDYYQGYLYSPPVPAAEFTRFVSP